MLRSFLAIAIEDLTAFRVRHVLLLVSILTSNEYRHIAEVMPMNTVPVRYS